MSRNSGKTFDVFPAHAGVFPTHPVAIVRFPGLPRARGGVSIFARFPLRPGWSSPRTRGCFQVLALAAG